MAKKRLRGALVGIVMLAGFAAVATAQASKYPEKPIKAVQGFAVGGNADTIARLVGGEMAKTLNQAVVVEAVTGAGGTLGSAAVARAAPDGYTMLLATGGQADMRSRARFTRSSPTTW